MIVPIISANHETNSDLPDTRRAARQSRIGKSISIEKGNDYDKTIEERSWIFTDRDTYCNNDDWYNCGNGIIGVYRCKVSAGKSAAASELRSLYSAQQNYHIQNARFANISELASANIGQFGTVTSDKFSNGRYTYEMVPSVPPTRSLSDSFTMEANGQDNSQIIKFQINERASIVQLLPVVRNW